MDILRIVRPPHLRAAAPTNVDFTYHGGSSSESGVEPSPSIPGRCG